MIGLGCYAGGQFIGFEMDFGKLGQKERTEDRETALVRGTTKTNSPAVIFARSSEEARSLHEQLETRTRETDFHPRIKSHQSLFTLIPEQQEEKRTWVKRSAES